MYLSKFTVTDEMQKECINKVLCRNMMIVCYGCMMVGALVAIFGLFKTGFSGVWDGVTLMVMIYLLGRLSPRTIRMQLERDYHMGAQSVVNFGDNDIVSSQGGQRKVVKYEDVKGVYKLNKGGVIVFGKDMYILFDPNNFKTGDPEKFDDFMHSKCPNMKKIVDKRKK